MISFLGARSQLAAALQTRLASLKAMADIKAVSGVPLRTATNKQFPAETYGFGQSHNPWFISKSVVADGPAGGHVYILNNQTLLFIAIREQLVTYAVTQDFAEIQKYSFKAATLRKTVDCSVSPGRFQKKFSPVMALPPKDIASRESYIRFSLVGDLHYCQSGLIIGVLPIPEDWRKRKQ